MVRLDATVLFIQVEYATGRGDKLVEDDIEEIVNDSYTGKFKTGSCVDHFTVESKDAWFSAFLITLLDLVRLDHKLPGKSLSYYLFKCRS